jgi:hypothetical protein
MAILVDSYLPVSHAIATMPKLPECNTCQYYAHQYYAHHYALALICTRHPRDQQARTAPTIIQSLKFDKRLRQSCPCHRENSDRGLNLITEKEVSS